jgi:hypothetical protein
MAWLAGVALPLAAEPLSLDRGVFSAGGGLVTANGFSATGTIGQPVAHTLATKAVTYFSLAGFWSQEFQWVSAVPVVGASLVNAEPGPTANLVELPAGLGGQARRAAAPSPSAVALQIRLLAAPSDRVEVWFQAIAGRTYQVQAAAALSGPWAVADTIVASTSGALNFIDTPAGELRFFRILEP